MTLRQIDFYSAKGTALPRFVYRHLAAAIQAATGGQDRANAIAQFLAVLGEKSASGDFLKFKWVLPPFVRQILTVDEQALLDQRLAELRGKRTKKLFDVYPHCGDEFSLDPAFIDATFDAAPAPLFDRTTPIFTLGSCFARNITVYLRENGFLARTFNQVEDLNSPLSNALMFGVIAAPMQERRDYLTQWLGRLLTGQGEDVVGAAVEQELARLESLRELTAAARLLTITLGNTVDYFLPAGQEAPRMGDNPVAPKFLGVAESENVNTRNALSKLLRQAGAELRLGTFEEAKTAIQRLFDSVRAINPTAPILFTLSPVPIDSAMGVQKPLPYGAIELDCISKSTLRAAIAELLVEWRGGATYYFPSYEIVRWIGAMLPAPNFGEQDAASRHVSEGILNAIYAFFLRKHGPGQ